MSDVRLILGDCLEILPTLEAGSVDAVVTDPPYGKDWSRGENAVGDNNKVAVKRYIKWDKNRPEKFVFDEIFRISTKQFIWGGNHFSDYLPPSNCWVVWDKTVDLPEFIFADAELAWCSLNKVIRIFRHRNHGFIRDGDDERLHPTQKPLALMLWVIENYTIPNDIILDPFMGSGTTGVACVQTGRNFIGIEIDPTYFAIAEKRIKQAQLQLRMEI